MNPTLENELNPCTVLAALVWADNINPPFEIAGMPRFLADVVDRARAGGEDFWPAGVRSAVRDMLRHGHYKPSGRAKPASEFLLRAAIQGDFPTVCGPVDVNNAVSLETGLPATIFDADLSGTDLCLRRGREGESYVFNSAGQSIDLWDLLVVCKREGDQWVPCGNPVKDSMATKLRPETRRVVGVIYAPIGMAPADLEPIAQRFAELLESQCGASEVGWKIVNA